MQPYKVEFYVYANSNDEVKHLQQSLKDFVHQKRMQGIAVTATKLTKALSNFSNNYFVNQYLKKK